MLVHICCSVDSHFFIEKLQSEYPDEKLTAFFYDPNIHPYSEYKLRLLDVERSCKKLGIELIEGEYDYENWLEAVRGLEREPEKGERCMVCFDRRFEVSAQKALELGEKSMTTTLLVSPKKSQDQLIKSGEAFYKTHGVEFIAFDYRKDGGTADQSRVAKEQKLYRQDYCGCIYGLTIQREQQDKLLDELFNPISNQILPASIEERLKLYKERLELEEKGIDYRIIKERFLNYRLMRSYLVVDKKVIPSYPLIYSTLANNKTNGVVEHEIDGVYYLNRSEVKFISLKYFNTLSNSNYNSTKELIFNSIDVKNELDIRYKITQNPLDISAIIVVDEIPSTKIELFLESKIYEDTKEKLTIL